ncbi:hypothetical protein Y023_1673 [Burkholderia pseudomallei A79D]|nr:hypothetical protein X995_895 [Burkholderia pseudomallei B03]AIV94913.1 hypothetical protein X996_847 [Burkholderia pseudomallei A79A]AJX76535.1 hypothetical protein BG16_2213 [Burkholderia pseudomallei MSHR2543]KGY04630.1 hypothetical protein Y023_1673 [Burkholderia pseudomallei A79D]KGY05377.1 hypothetical protein X997_1715 [Burkholderia pseudomallei A79C]
MPGARYQETVHRRGVSYPVDFQSFAWITFPKLPASQL